MRDQKSWGLVGGLVFGLAMCVPAMGVVPTAEEPDAGALHGSGQEAREKKPAQHLEGTGKAGEMTFTLDEGDPRCTPKELARRVGKNEDEMRAEYAPGEVCNVYAPADYDPAGAPMGLVVCVIDGKAIGADLRPVLDGAHLICAAVDGHGKAGRRAGTLLDVAWNMGRIYKIDPTRVYILEEEDSGFANFAVSDVYTGVISLEKVIHPGTLKYKRGRQEWTVFAHDGHTPAADMMAAAKKCGWAIMVDPKAGMEDGEYLTAEAMGQMGYSRLKMMKVAAEDRKYPNVKPDVLKEAIAFLDSGKPAEHKTAVAATETTTEPSVAAGAEPMADAPSKPAAEATPKPAPKPAARPAPVRAPTAVARGPRPRPTPAARPAAKAPGSEGDAAASAEAKAPAQPTSAPTTEPAVSRAHQMLSMAKLYDDNGMTAQAKAKLKDLIAQFPDEPEATEAKEMLAKMGG